MLVLSCLPCRLLSLGDCKCSEVDANGPTKAIAEASQLVNGLLSSWTGEGPDAVADCPSAGATLKAAGMADTSAIKRLLLERQNKMVVAAQAACDDVAKKVSSSVEAIGKLTDHFDPASDEAGFRTAMKKHSTKLAKEQKELEAYLAKANASSSSSGGDFQKDRRALRAKVL